MWLCNLFTILVCLTSVENLDAVQEARYGKLIEPPRQSAFDENNTKPTENAHDNAPLEAQTSETNP